MLLRYILVLLFTSYCVLAIAQKPLWQWAAVGNNRNEGMGRDIAVDAANNMYVIGSFNDTLVLGTHTLISAGLSDIFVAKYNSAGQVLWAKSAGGIGRDFGMCIAVDATGCVYAGSVFYDTAMYGSQTFISKGENDINLTKYDSMGNMIWSKAWGSIYTEYGMGIATGRNNKVYITGLFANSSPFGTHATIDFDADTLESYGYDDVYIASIDSSGTVDWVRQAGGESNDGSASITVDKSGGLYIWGRGTNSKMAFDNDTLYGKNVFLAKYDSLGNVLWLRGATGNFIYESGITTDSSCNVYITGTANNTAQPLYFGSILLTGNDASFIAKYDSSGNILWAKNSGVNKYGSAFDMVSDASGNLFVTSSINGWSLLGNDTLQGYGNEDIFVSKYDKNGNYIWVVNAGGDTLDAAYGIVLDNAGDILITGNISSKPANFGATLLNATSGRDMFVAKLSGTTSIEHTPKAKSTIQVYPNPVNNELVVAGAKFNSTLQLFDVLGRVVYRTSINHARQNIRTSAFVPGTYILQLTDATGQREIFKVVKE